MMITTTTTTTTTKMMQQMHRQAVLQQTNGLIAMLILGQPAGFKINYLKYTSNWLPRLIFQ
jgi:hypothetical protein